MKTRVDGKPLLQVRGNVFCANTWVDGKPFASLVPDIKVTVLDIKVAGPDIKVPVLDINVTVTDTKISIPDIKVTVLDILSLCWT